ncbi:hypothetical protein FHETE_8946 [Fusarium heterosporum]|uniref:Uncharacterized protein n=1 Tax=Fusarium heterosporum TaxID=42747 RepID=A0A8H5T0Q5_FUSHE|nr:hypothetical protein FHETE_8946 [Fusarium heterosporum]
MSDGKRIKATALDFADPKSEQAIRAVLDIIHGDVVKTGDPRLLFYMTEVHKALGSPRKTYDRDSSLGSSNSVHRTFFCEITRSIGDVAKENKYLHRVEGWLLFALIAENLKSHPIQVIVCSILTLFCRSEQQGLPDEVRGISIRDGEWLRLENLRLVDIAMLDERKNHIDTIFKALRLLSHQLESFEQGTLLSDDELNTCWSHWVAPCPCCQTISSHDYHRELVATRLWPMLIDEYKDRVFDLIFAIRDISEKTLDAIQH